MNTERKSAHWKIVNSQQWEVNGITLGYALSEFSKKTLHQVGNENERVRLHFGLQGDYGFTYHQLNRSFDLAGGHHNLMYSKGIDLEIRNKTLVIETFGIDFPRELFINFTREGADDLLKIFLEDIMAGKPVILSDPWGTIDINIQKIIDEIKLNPYEGSLKKIFLLAKALELLVLCIDHYHQIKKQTYTHIKTQHDKEKIIAARDFINSRITDPPNLTEVAHSVGLNEFKLKSGFKEMFHNTLFEYLTQRRLNIAGQSLLDTDKTVAEIAHDLGYSSPQHFHLQFRKHMGMTPNQWRNK
ncbi:MAG: helix-turn-helix transcriptional regulator [Saprospiraceae bacterium]|nr:helix-turn-helix transcriptional regulator [Saprospiraceae bacterium]